MQPQTNLVQPSSTSRTDVLNPVLYARLMFKFKSVKVHNSGQHAIIQSVRSPARPGQTEKICHQSGEYYAVCCPFCGEQKHRLWINYRYGDGVDTRSGRRQNTYLAHCYRNSCLAVSGRREQLEDIIFGPNKLRFAHRPATQPSASELEDVMAPVVPPGKIAYFNELPSDHPAAVYLRQRNFDPVQLSVACGVGVCVDAAPKYALMQGRVYIPVIANGALAGWQGRAVRDDQPGPKYYNVPGMKKSMLLYNIDRAIKQPYVVVVEGVPSVWRIGPAAVCAFGKTLSRWQVITLHTSWPGKPIFVCLDHDARNEVEIYCDQLRQAGAVAVPVFLPDDRDPADYTHTEINDLLGNAAYAARVNVKLS